ncbi:Na(+)/H(+) exchanger beta-like [Paramacrobiotus metropolitanus]|uniref:Na(+)/H(+) exchanger beta-like n=1 Tax=Paramacrobiotus metropolitanus TaxID=2943436 RepID=UPI0024462834|nr:Na(+)/H(+) exchanger beta-like [Paramacrobiotus metropolitanus]
MDPVSPAPADTNLTTTTPTPGHDDDADHEQHGISVISLHWKYVEGPLVVCVFLLLTSLVKIGFHHADFLSTILPESCMLIVLGVAVGGFIRLLDAYKLTLSSSYFEFSARTFFLFLLPPVMLESAYSLHDREFVNNLGTILTYAVFGTVFNAFTIGPTLWGLAKVGGMGALTLGMTECLAFSSLISAVDPVAVLAIFQEVGVNAMLYFLLFGESLLNDAVTVVLYNMMVAFASQPEVTVGDIGKAVASFFTVSVGGLVIGACCGIFTAVITKYTEHVRVVEPIAMFIMAYTSYILAELFHLSGIISIITCGLLQWQYAVHNVSFKSRTTVKYFSKMAAAVCDAVIFLVLGLVIVNDSHIWHTGFVLWTLLFCIVYRFIGVFGLTWLANKINRMRKVNLEEQFIMAYGGLRGAIAFALVNLLQAKHFPHREMLVTTTVVVILFTVFIQGTTIKPLVKQLRIRKQETKKPSIFQATNLCLFDHVMSGIEEISGRHGHNYWREILDYYDEKYLKPWLQKTPIIRDKTIMDIFAKQCLKEHFAHLYGTQQADQFVNRRMRREGSALSSLSTVPTLADMHAFPSHPNMAGGRLTAPGGTQPPAPTALTVNLPTANEISVMGAEEYKPDESVLNRLRKRFRKEDKTKISFGHDVREALDHASRHGPHVQIRQKYNPNLIQDDESELEYQMRARAVRAQRIAKRQFGQRALGLMPIRSFLSRVGTSMTNLANLGRRRNGAPARPKDKPDKRVDGAAKEYKAVPGNLTAAEKLERSRKISRESSKMRISMIHAGSLSSMAEEGVEDVVRFNTGDVPNSRRKPTAGIPSDEDDEEGEVLQMRHIAPSATAPHLERIDERASVSSETGSVIPAATPSGGRLARSGSAGPGRPAADSPLTTVASVEFVPMVTPAHRPADGGLNSASEVQSPRPDYQPESTPLLSQRR